MADPTPDAATPPTGQALPPAVAVLIEHEGRVLMIQRAAHIPLGGYWTMVSGRVEPGETLEAACHREVREEVGLTITLGPVFHRGITSNKRFHLTYFTARLVGGDLRPDPAEVADARWLTHEETDLLTPMLETTRAVLRQRR